MTDWTIKQAYDMYNIAHWGGGYFDINDAGHLLVRPACAGDGPGVDLYRLTHEIKAQGLSLPVLVRFSGILRDRVDTLCSAFEKAMQQDGYRGQYTAVYPIKVNQQRSVVEEIVAGGRGRIGLEAGSKPELLAVLGHIHANGIVVCNGYKDREYIRLALIGQRLGHRVYIVVEKPSELELILDEAGKLGVRPVIGVRVRLASIGAGKWQNTGGEKSKFGLSAAQVLAVIERLREADRLDILRLLHFHLGSQIANIRDIQRGMRECARYYAELRRLGVDIECVDVGGGLGIDYEGTRSRSFCSMNYSVQEYANNIARAMWEVCEAEGLDHPGIITESGRAMTAHHAVLIANVIDTEQAPDPHDLTPPHDDEPIIIHDLWQGYDTLRHRPAEQSVLEAYHDAAHWLAEAQTMYTHGVLTLEQRARIEEIYFATCHLIRRRLQPSTRAHRELLDELNEKLADKYFCNFSLFQSMPDVWAIKQIFPVMPLHRLGEAPTRRGVLQDITCDSDGRVDQYVDGEGLESSLPLHPLETAEPYLLGMFLVGAYQEILGDMHNLFGDTDSVHVELLPDGSYRLSQPLRGDSIDAVLRYVHFDPEHLRAAYRSKIEAADWLEAREREDYLRALTSGLDGYTYLQH